MVTQCQNHGGTGSSNLWPVDLKLTHLDWNPDASLIHFQGRYLTICELDYTILQGEMQNVPKIKAAVDIGEFCLVEDLTSAQWYRGRVQSRMEDIFDVFLIDHGNILSVNVTHISSCTHDLFILPPKIVCGFLANVLLLQSCSQPVVEQYFSNLISTNVTGYIQALFPHKVLLLEAPDINSDLVRHGFGRYVDTDTFFFLVHMLTEMPVKESIDRVPDLLIENPRGPEFCFKKSGFQAYEQILSFCGPRLSSGTRAEVKVTAAVNSRLFYCQMAGMESDLWEMSKKLALFCEHKTEKYKQNGPESVGLLCSVKGKDGKWYRGFAQFLPVNSQVRVFFVDYGYFESVKVDNIHKLPPYFCSKPVMAFPCSLSSPADQDEVLKTQQLRLLKSALLGGVLKVEICGFDEEQHVYYVTIIGVEDIHTKEPETIQSPHQVESVEDELSLKGGCLCYETVMAAELSKTLKAEVVQEGSVFVGYVVHVKNPGHFWIRTQKHNDEFKEMMSEITEHFKQAKLDEDVLLNPKPGTLCCAVYKGDMHFYRGIITDTLEHGAEVLFIDFGKIKKVPHMLIKKIPEKVASNSALAICCSLANVCPLDEVWTSTTSDFFRRAVRNKALLVHVIQMRKSKIIINLLEMGSHTSISELLMLTQQVDYIPVEPVVKNDTNMMEKITRLGFSAVKCCLKSVPKEELFVDAKEWLISTVLNKQVTAKILGRNDDGSFVVELFSGDVNINEKLKELILSEDKPALLKISDYLNSSAIRTSLKAPTSLKINDIVLAEFEEDGALFRSLVKNITGSSQYQVEFVDYGNSAVVGKEKIYSIPKEHLTQPRFSIWCSLQDSSSYKTDSSFTDAVMNKSLMVEFVRQCGTNWKVKIEVLEEVVLNGTRESNGEMKIISEKEKEFTSSLSQIEEKNGLDEQNIREECRTEMRTPVMSTAEDKVMLKPQSVTHLTSLKVKSRTCGKKRTKKKATSKKSCSAMKGCPDVSLPTVTQARAAENGTILSVQPNGSFYVRLNKTSDMLTTLEQHIVQCLLKCKVVARKDVKPGLKCLVQIHGENKWQRAVVEHEGMKKIKAFLVDQGITNDISCSSIRQQCHSMDKVPNLALLCRMNSAGFCEEDDHKLWCETLKQMIGEEVKLFFVHYSETDNLWIVEIVINRLFLIPKNKLCLQPDEKNIPSCAESQSGTILDTCSPQQLDFAQIDLDKEYSGTAAAVMTPSEFWIVLDCFLMKKVSIVLDDLPGQMSPIPDAHLKPGTCCLLNSHLKNKWCRAEIVNTDSPMVLFLVDYGEHECIPYRDHSKLRKLPSALTDIPKVIYPCCLRGIKPVGVGEQWTDEAVVFFKEFLSQKDLQIFFREIVSHKQWRVDVLAGGVHVSKELVDAGHAGYTDVMLQLR
ncbi:tudor domain-containing protein 15-like [Pholidichthys leucotaenia]